MPDITVRSRQPGAPGDPLPELLLRLETERLTVRELITRAVEEQLREVAAGRLERDAVRRQYLLDAEIRLLARTGVVRLPSDQDRLLDPATEVDRALRAFEAGAFALFLGTTRAESLDAEVTVRLGEPVLFLRLTPLVGG